MKLLAIPEARLELDSLGRIGLVQTQGDNAGGTIVLRDMLKGLEGHRMLISVKYEEEAMISVARDTVEVA